MYRGFGSVVKKVLPLAFLSIVAVGSAFGANQTWTLSGVTFSDGGTASGSFVTDGTAAENLVSWNITTTTGSVVTGQTYTGSISPAVGESASTPPSSYTFANSGFTIFFAINTSSPLTPAGTTVTLAATSNEENGLDRTVTAGSLTNAPQTAPTFTKAFSPSTISQLQTSTLTFTITNPNSVPVTGLTFTDSYPAGLIGVFGVSNSCGFTLSGTNPSFTASGGSVGAGPGTSCTLVITVQATSSGSLVNTTSTLTSNAPTAPAATATLVVNPISDFPFQVRYSANLNIGESYIDIGNDGANGAPLLGPGFGAASGNLCVNVYAFDPNEELVSCCSCLVTPDQTVHLGVNADLTSKTLTGVVPTSVTVKLVATLAGTGGSGTGTVCNNSAASITGIGQAVTGMTAFGTTLHPTQTAGTYATTETTFTPATLNPAELASIVGRCAAIIGNASGFGICTSCHNGALGASKL